MYYLKLAKCKITKAVGREKVRIIYFLLILFVAWFSGLFTLYHSFSIGQALGVCFLVAAYGCAVTSLKNYDGMLSMSPFEQNAIEAETPNLIEGEVREIETIVEEKKLELPNIKKSTPSAKPYLKKAQENLDKLERTRKRIDELDAVVDKKAIMKIVNDSYDRLKEYVTKSTQTIAAIYIASQAIERKDLTQKEIDKISGILTNCDIAFAEYGQMLTQIPDAINIKDVDIRFDIQASSKAIEQFIRNSTPRTDA